MYNDRHDGFSPIILGFFSTTFAVSGSLFFLILAAVGYCAEIVIASNQKEIPMNQNVFASNVTTIVRAFLLAFAGYFVSVAAGVGSS